MSAIISQSLPRILEELSAMGTTDVPNKFTVLPDEVTAALLSFLTQNQIQSAWGGKCLFQQRNSMTT